MNAINVKRLITMGACEDQVKAMYDLIGDGDAPLTVEFAVKHAQVFDWDWAAYKILLYESLEDYLKYTDAARILWLDYYTQEKIEHSEYKIALAKLFAAIYLKGMSHAEV